ncbi:MAG TPA: MFS transporter [Anaerolineae bacterium]|nr:MFS transporter [Anaerolineae bacterium]
MITTSLFRQPEFRRTLGYYGLILCIGLGTGVLGPLLPSLAAQTQSSVGAMGQLFLVGALGGLLGTLLGGRLYDRFRGHSVLGLAQIVGGLLMACIPFIPSLGWLLALVIVKGVMDGLINNGTNTLLVWTHREKVSPYMNGLHFCFGLGAFLSPLVVAQVVDIPGAYRWVYVGLAAISVLAGLRVVTMAGSPQAAHPTESAPGAVQPRVIPYSVVLATTLFLFFYVGAEITFGGWVYTYAVELNLAPAAQAAYLTSGFWLTFTIGRLLSVPLATRFAPRQIITAALVGCVAAMGTLLIFADSTMVLWGAALLVGFCMAPIYASGFTLAVQGLKLTARASSIILMGDSGGGMVLPWLVGQVLEATGPRAMVYLVLGSLIGDLLAFAGLLRVRAKVVGSEKKVSHLESEVPAFE